MGNKFYDGLAFSIPQLCAKGSYMGKMVDSLGVGLICDADDPEFPNKVYEYYVSIDWDVLESTCKQAFDKMFAEYEYGQKVIHEFSNGMKDFI